MSLLKSHGWTKAVCTIGMVLGLCANSWSVEFAGGTGEPDYPYHIATAEQLISIGQDPNLLDKHFVLVADIDLDPNRTGGCVFEGVVIAAYDCQADVERQFTGTLDGRGHAIYGLTMRVPSASLEVWYCDDCVGLFGTIGADGRVANLSVVNASVVTEENSSYVAILVGANYGNLDNCSVSGSVSGGTYLGGFVGGNAGNVTRCTSLCTVDSGGTAGGFAGANGDGGTLYECVSGGTTTAGNMAGGLVVGNSGTVSHCRRYGVTNGHGERTGGLTAYNSGTLEYCTHIGTVNGQEYTGGLVSFNSGMVFRCKSSTTVSGEEEVGGACGWNRGHLVECSSAGFVRGTDTVGGFTGRNRDDGRIDTCFSNCGVVGINETGGFVGHGGGMVDCYCTGMVSGRTYVGGFGGSTGGNTHCYSTSVVHAVLRVQVLSFGRSDEEHLDTYLDHVGGFSGYRFLYGDDIGCFWDVEASGQAESDGGTPMTTAQMQRLETYLEAGWDFVNEGVNGEEDTWTIYEGTDYPRLWWEQATCSE